MNNHITIIAFHLNIVPPKTTSQTKRLVMIGGKPRFFHKKEHQQAEGDLMALMAPYRPAVPLSGPLALRIDFVFPWRKSEQKWKIALGRIPNDTRPDCDNLGKLAADVLTKLGFYNDDGQVADSHITKAWGDKVGIYIQITPIEQASKPVPPPKVKKTKSAIPDQPTLL